MRCDRYIFIFFLYFTSRRYQARAANGLTELETVARGIGIKSQRVTDALSHVYVKSNRYEIYYYDGNDSREIDYHENTLSKFYVCVNCVFATWTRGELFKFIEIFPVLYSWKFETIHNNIFRAVYDEKIVPTCNDIAEHTLRFVDVLFSFMEKVTYSSLVDTSLLRALLSLNFKIHYMHYVYKRKFVDDDGTYSKEGIDVLVVQLLIEVISEIQNFMVVNCSLSDIYTKNIFFYYLEPNPSEIKLTNFLDDIDPMELTHGERCNIDKMLLTNILNKWEETDKSILRGILFLNYNVGCDEQLMFYDIYDIIESFYDLQIIHWYQQVVSNTIMSLLFTKINLFFNEYEVNSKFPIIKEAFQTINDTFLPAYNDLPVNIAENFKLLASKDQYDQDDVEQLKDTFSRVVLVPAAEVLLESYTFTNTDEELLKTLLNSSLEEFLKDLLENIKDLTCFLQLFKFLNAEYNTYYTLFNKDYNKIVDKIFTSCMCRWEKDRPTADKKKQILKHNFHNLSEVDIEFIAKDNADDVTEDPSRVESAQIGLGFEKEISGVDDKFTAKDNAYDVTEDPSLAESTQTRPSGDKDTDKNILDEGCGFFTGLIHQCTIILDHMNGFSWSPSEDNLNSTLVHNRLDIIRSSLHAAHTSYLDRRLQRTAYNLLPIIDISFKQDFDDSGENHRLRMMSLIAVELNYYGLEYCRPPKHNFLQYNNMSINAFGNVSFYENDIQRFIEIVQNTKTPGRQDLAKLGQFKFMGLDGIYTEYLNNSHDYDSYKNVIKIQWKGEKKSIGEIYNGIVNHVSQPFYYYAFADTLLKFSVAALFYEVEHFELETIDSRLIQMVKKSARLTKSYIKKLTDDIVDEMQFIYFSVIQRKHDEPKLNALRQKIINTFKEIGVSINVNLPKTTNNDLSHGKSESYLCASNPQNVQQKIFSKTEELLKPISSATKTITMVTQTLNEYIVYFI